MHNNASSKLHTLWQQGLTQQALRLTAQSTYFQIETIMLKCENADTSMPSGVPQEHGCVQWSIDSRNSAIHNGYCTSLHPSSSCEPRHRLLNLYMKNTSRPQISQCKHIALTRHNCNAPNAHNSHLSVDLTPTRQPIITIAR